ncbi:MAG TPA: methyltransferase domain-containing protein [Nocardioidaceae bacterium]|nr:methyltransferase domain-containing protein [Nocardioidaceae bacterium]
MTAAISPLDAYAAALAGSHCVVVGEEFGQRPLPVQRWARDVSRRDRMLLDHCEGDTLDVGCGPGRMTAALTARGHRCLGIDVSPEAVAHARRRGADAVVADVFASVPHAGQWHTALLADGNIGIGGDPVRLLRQVSGVLAAQATIVVDLAPPGVPTRTSQIRLIVDGLSTEPFAWSVVGVDAVRRLARESDLDVATIADAGGRWFALLRPRLLHRV